MNMAIEGQISVSFHHDVTYFMGIRFVLVAF